MTISRGSIFGRITALAIMIGAAYGVNAIAHGKYGFGCGVSCGSCCARP
jgi:hypothetical protein